MFERTIGTDLTRRRFLTTAALLASSTLLMPALIACGADESGTQPDAVGTEPVRGGTLRVGIGGGSSTETLDPHNAVTGVSIAQVAQFSETLLRYSSEFGIEPQLALSVEPDATATTWTIKLRDGVTFHDGKAFTADDVVYTFKKILNKDTPGASAAQLATLDLDKIEIKDPLTLVVTFTQPYAAFKDALSMAATSAIRIVPVGFDMAAPIGTGPFKFVSFTPGQQAKFDRYDKYWKAGQPYLDSVEINGINDDAARINGLVSGQLDAITTVPAGNVAVVEANPALKLLVSESGGWNPIVMRTDTAPFDDVRVRQAFRLIADRNELVTSALAGQGVVANDLFGRYDPAYNTTLATRAQNIEEAKRLLAEAGQSNLTVQLVTSKISDGVVAAAQVFAQQAAKAGVTIDVLEVQPTDFWSKHFLQAPLTQSNWATRSYLMQAMDSMLPTAPYNETFWSNDEWQALVEKAMATADDTERGKLVQQAQAIEWDQGGYINWAWYNIVDAYSAKFSGFVPDKGGMDLSTFRFVDVWKNS